MPTCRQEEQQFTSLFSKQPFGKLHQLPRSAKAQMSEKKRGSPPDWLFKQGAYSGCGLANNYSRGLGFTAYRAPELTIAFGLYLLPVVLLDLASVSAQLTSRLCNEGKQSGNQYAPREPARWHKQRPHRPLHDNNMLAAKHPC